MIERIARTLQRGEEIGVFRAGIDPNTFYISISALSFFYLSNIYTLGAALDIDMADGVPILADPLSGLDPAEAADANELAAALRAALAAERLTLNAKISVVVDGGAADDGQRAAGVVPF